MGFLVSEENICESCLATILPTGCASSVCISKDANIVLRFKADFNYFVLCFVISMFQTWPNLSAWWCFTADTCFTRSVYLLPELWVILPLFGRTVFEKVTALKPHASRLMLLILGSWDAVLQHLQCKKTRAWKWSLGDEKVIRIYGNVNLYSSFASLCC